jgi:hypothetical protein
VISSPGVSRSTEIVSTSACGSRRGRFVYKRRQLCLNSTIFNFSPSNLQDQYVVPARFSRGAGTPTGRLKLYAGFTTYLNDLKVSGGGHTAKLSHELLAAAASYEVCLLLLYNSSSLIMVIGCQSVREARRKERQTRQPRKGRRAAVSLTSFCANLDYANSTIVRSAGFTGAFIDRVAETKGMDEVDKQRAKHAGMFLNLFLKNSIY